MDEEDDDDNLQLLDGRVLDLMVKNVSKDDPLSPEEIRELKSYRSRLSNEQWKVWLQYARNEKTRRLILASIEYQNTNQRNEFTNSTNNNFDNNDINNSPIKKQTITPDRTRKTLANDDMLAAIIQNQKNCYNNSNDNNINEFQRNDVRYSPNIVQDDLNIVNDYSNNNNNNDNININDNDIDEYIHTNIESNSKREITSSIKAGNMSPFFLSQSNNHHHHNINNKSNKFDEITDIATASALRIDSVHSAARCLIASIEADMKDKISASPGIMEDKSTTLSILQSMVTSLEKSSNSLEQIIKLKNDNSMSVSMRTGMNDHEDTNESFQRVNDTMDEGVSRVRAYSVGMDQNRGFQNLQRDKLSSRGRSPSPSTLRRSNSRDNVSYGSLSAGYSWQGIKYKKAQERIVKICVAEGPLVKAFEDFPLRLDLESSTADVVWREERPTYNNNDDNSSRSTIMRRERFNFDDIFCGPSALGRMKTYVQYRTRKALIEGSNIVFLCFACGLSSSPLDPPLALILGSKGGSGVASMVINELFNTVSASPSSVSSTTLTVTMSAVIFADGKIVDLLGSCSGNNNNTNTDMQPKVQKYRNGQYYLANASQVMLTSSNDYDRIVGVILGRRSLWREFAPWFGPSFNKFPEAPWVYSQSEETNFMLTFNVSYTSGISKQRNTAKFSFVCPCGENWGSPGQEINQLIEAISYLPYAAPPSLMKSSQLNTLLVDSNFPTSAYVNIVNVIRNESSTGPLDRLDSTSDNNVVHTSLSTLRSLSSLNNNQ